ncbi:hypothetical protein [Synechococcus sp. SYN20]|uniref:hypothetical protein n=1 Tax=Synechococcus sp. SYN20 TaxID=1050714 RepID=UPI001647C4F5|nr:hypothetical protein [Synechococcus sp. SYN20]
MTDARGIERIEAETFEMPAMALRPDQTEATQILFLEMGSDTIENVALLHAGQPFIAMPDGSFTPNVVEFMPLMEPIEISSSALNHTWVLDCVPTLNIEAVNIDPDELETSVDYLAGQIVDEVIVNRRSFNHEMVKRGLLQAEFSSFDSTRQAMEALVHRS